MKTLKYLAIAASLLGSASCSKDTRDKLGEEQGRAKVAIMNLVTPNRPSSTTASVGLQGYYLFMDNKQLYTQSLIPNKTTGYFLADPGARIFRADSTEIKANAILPSAPVSTSTVQTEAGKYYSVFYTGKVQAPEVVITTDDLARPPAGKAKVRVIHLSPDAGALDIAGALTTSTSAPTVMFSNLSYKTQPVFTEINAGFYRFYVRDNGGTTNIGTFTQDNQVVPSFIPGGAVRQDFSMNLESGMVYTLVIRGYRTPTLAAVGQLANPISVGALINAYY
jgi:hypothetical protein